jgi:hypothetical protein
MDRELELWKSRQSREEAEDAASRAQRKSDLERQIEANAARRDVLYATTEQESLDAQRAEAEYAAFIARERANPEVCPVCVCVCVCVCGWPLLTTAAAASAF